MWLSCNSADQPITILKIGMLFVRSTMRFNTLEALAFALLRNRLTADELKTELKDLNPEQRYRLFQHLDETQTVLEPKGRYR